MCRYRNYVIPKQIQKTLVAWYHNVHVIQVKLGPIYLSVNIFAAKASNNPLSMCFKCHMCQFLKRNKSKLPAKQAESQPWDMLCIDKYGMTLKKRAKSTP